MARLLRLIVERFLSGSWKNRGVEMLVVAAVVLLLQNILPAAFLASPDGAAVTTGLAGYLSHLLVPRIDGHD